MLLLVLLQAWVLEGQSYYSKTGLIHFVSEAAIEKIEASNHNALVVLDATTGQMDWSVLVKGFQFEKALMQEHFNENYMESDKFPKANFKGTVTNIKDIHLNKEGIYPVQVKGDLTLHGVTKSITASGQVIVKDGKITATSSFDVLVADYNIVIPKVVRDNVAKTVKITVGADLLFMK